MHAVVMQNSYGSVGHQRSACCDRSQRIHATNPSSMPAVIQGNFLGIHTQICKHIVNIMQHTLNINLIAMYQTTETYSAN